MAETLTRTGGPIAGRVVDLDSHEMIPVHMWADTFGPEAELLAPLSAGLISRAGANSTVRDDIISDNGDITEETVWTQKGPDAPSAIDMARRPAVLDAMGVRRQLLFPTFALIGINLFYNRAAAEYFGFDPTQVDPKAAGRGAVMAYNRWAARQVAAQGDDRVRPVGVVLAESVERMVADAEALLAAGLRTLWIPSGAPPAGLSPAHTSLDPFWKLTVEAGASVVLHVGTEFGFLDPAWYADVPQFSYGPRSSIEFPIEPYRASTVHLAVEAFLGAAIMGGTFERHPGLRFGVIECGAHWVGPLAEKLDLWSTQFGSRLSDSLSLAPSGYLARQVRVTPFFFEPVADYMARHPDLQSVYSYGSDYPHVEGGKHSLEVFQTQLEPLGSDAVEAFFVRNGDLLFDE
jgi:predicted TIM-barrel fold metal-dependent hydrolase